jgi:beta-mannosidase
VTIPAGNGFFYVVEAKKNGAADFDPTLRFVTFPGKYKQYDLPAAKVTLAAAGKPGVFTLAADRPAFFVKPEASEFAGAFDDASFALLPGESRTVSFRSFDAKMPSAGDVVVNHLGQTYR